MLASLGIAIGGCIYYFNGGWTLWLIIPSTLLIPALIIFVIVLPLAAGHELARKSREEKMKWKYEVILFTNGVAYLKLFTNIHKIEYNCKENPSSELFDLVIGNDKIYVVDEKFPDSLVLVTDKFPGLVLNEAELISKMRQDANKT